MAKLRVTGLKRIQTGIRKEITKELRSKVIREKMGEIVANEIKENPVGSPSVPYLRWRERYDSLNQTDPSYNRFRINFAFTGELLKDLARNVRLETSGGIFNFVFNNSKKLHAKYNGVRKKIGSRSPFFKIQEGLEKLGYPFITKKATDDITKFVQQTVLERLKKTFRVR